MTECAKCGACCEVIPLGHSPDQLLEEAGREIESAIFAVKHWSIISDEEVTKRNPLLTRKSDDKYFYECDMYNWENKECTAHEDKPPVCSRFPWYDHEPIPFMTYLPKCSFWRDVPKEKWPEGIDPL